MGLMKKIKIFIVDDHTMLCEGLMTSLKIYPEIDVMGFEINPGEALKKLYDLEPDILVVEIQFQGQVSGPDLIKRCRKEMPLLKILVLSELDENIYAERVLHLGAHGYLNKKNSIETVVKALKKIDNGEIFISRAIASRIILGIVNKTSSRKEMTIDDFSDREFEIFVLIGKGYKSKAIAGKLNINVKTVETHRHRMKQKLNLNTSEELQRFAVDYMRGIR